MIFLDMKGAYSDHDAEPIEELWRGAVVFLAIAVSTDVIKPVLCALNLKTPNLVVSWVCCYCTRLYNGIRTSCVPSTA